MNAHFLDNWLEKDRAGRVGRILEAALRAADPATAVRGALTLSGDRLEVAGQSLDLAQYRRIRLVGAGKAARAMSLGLAAVLGERITGGLVITKHVTPADVDLLPGVRVLPGGHPVPNEDSLRSAQTIARFLSDCRADDLAFCLISGGGSALMTLPQEGVSLVDMQALTRLLLASGADIGEINTLRKHLDRVKGGGLARLASPARLVTLILSDVIGSPLDVIASGPTVADPSTYADALGILRKYRLEEKAPAAVVLALEKGLRGETPETIKPGDPLLERVTTQVIASNTQAAQAALERARAEGFNALLLTTYLQGEAAQAGGVLASILRQVDASGQPVARPACIVAGGETTVTLRGSGLGGRNQELALGAVSLLAGLQDVAFVTLATDGEDGPTDAAGAVVTGETLTRAREMGLDAQQAMQENDSYHFFEPMKGLLKPGPTGTNVNDLVVLFAF